MKMVREYAFEFNGFNFVSVVDVESEMYQRIKKLPEGMFIQMNLGALSELLADTPMNLEAIKERLVVLNAGGTQAFIELGKN